MGEAGGEGLLGGHGEDQEGAGGADVAADAVEGGVAGGGDGAEGFIFEPVVTGEGGKRRRELGGELCGEKEAGVGEGVAEVVDAAADF